MILAAESKDSLDNWDRSSVFMGMPFESSELTSISFIFIGQFMENLSHKFHYLGHFLPVMWVVSSCSFYPWTVAKQNTIFLLLSLRTWMEQRNFQVQCHSTCHPLRNTWYTRLTPTTHRPKLWNVDASRKNASMLIILQFRKNRQWKYF